MNISDLFDMRFGLNPKGSCHDPAICDYCRWLLKGKSGQAPNELRPEDADFVAEWQRKVDALLHRADELAKAGEGRGGTAFDRLKKDSLALADEVFAGPDRGIVFCRVAQTYDDQIKCLTDSPQKATVATGHGWRPYPKLEDEAPKLLRDVQKFSGWGENAHADFERARTAFLRKYPQGEDLVKDAIANAKLFNETKEMAYRMGFDPKGLQKLNKLLAPLGLPKYFEKSVRDSFESGAAACQRKKEARALVQRQNRKAEAASKKPVDGPLPPSSVELKSDSRAGDVRLPTGGHPNSILNLMPSKKWVIVSDETGTNFGNDAFAEPSKAGRYAFVLIPESARLPKLNPGWHAVEEKNLQSILKVAENLHQSGCGILGIPVRGLSPDNRQLWYACIETLLDLTVRLLPIDGETQVELNVEQRGVATADQNELLQKTVDDVMYHLALVNPVRAKEIHLTARFIGKYDSPWNGYADVVAYSWGCGKDMQKAFAPFGWIGPCLVAEDDKVAEAFRRCLELVHRGGALPIADWNILVTNREATAVGSLTGALLRTCGEEARKDASLWRGYLDYVLAHLDSKAIRMSLLMPQLKWLKEFEPDSEQLPPRLRLLWLTAQLALSNHQGGIQFGEVEHRQEFADLMASLKDEDAPLTCFAALHRAVELTDAFRFEEARELLRPWERESVAVPGLRYHAQVLSSIGQHEAFLGNNEKALEYFDMTFAEFTRLSEGQQREIDHTLAYAVIAAMDANSPRLPLLMAAYFYGGAYTVEGMIDMANQFAAVGEDEPDSKYAHAILLRYLVTLPEDDPVRKAYVARRSDWKDSADGHPWEMIAFYRAMLCAVKPSRIRYLKQAFALADQGGPTLQIIATVILGALLAEGEADAAVYAAKVESVIAQLPSLGADRSAALREQASNPQSGLALATKVLPFNFR